MDSVNQENIKLVKQNINTAWEKLKEISAKEHQQNLIEGFDANIKQMQAGTFRLVVMGEIKKGKSSFINALLGEEDLLPTASDVATSTVYKIIYGPKTKIEVHFQPDIDTGKRPPSLIVADSQLTDYGTENGNPDNNKNVDFISVEVPNELLKTGLVIVDTPGVGGLFKKHKNITWKYAPNADAIFFILDSTETVISQGEINFLQDLTSKMTKHIYFVQTKIDIPGKEQWQGWQERNKDELVEKLDIPETDLKYFPVSSKLKHRGDAKNKERFIVDSGFPQVLSFLEDDLVANKDLMICHEISGVMTGVFKTIKTSISQRAKIAQADTKEKLIELENELQIYRQKLDEWRETVYQKAIKEFSYSFQDIQRQYKNQLQHELNPQSSMVHDMVYRIRENDLSAENINAGVQRLQQASIDECSSAVIRVQESFNEKINQLISETASMLTESLSKEDLMTTDGLNCKVSEGFSVHIHKTLNMQFSSFDKARNSLYGGMAGGMLAGGALSLFFPPTAAVVVLGGIIGSLFGAYKGKELAENRKKEEAIVKLKQVLSETSVQIQRQAIQQFDDMAVQSRRNAEALFEQARIMVKENLDRQQQEINEAKNSSQQEMQEVLSKAKALVQEIDISMKLISGI